MSEVIAPLSGEVTEANARLADKPELVNEDPEGAGWILRLRISDPTVLDALMDRAAYAALKD